MNTILITNIYNLNKLNKYYIYDIVQFLYKCKNIHMPFMILRNTMKTSELNTCNHRTVNPRLQLSNPTLHTCINFCIKYDTAALHYAMCINLVFLVLMLIHVPTTYEANLPKECCCCVQFAVK